jgi:prepilin-type N-terminal cleavage/methylation domain-containing protein
MKRRNGFTLVELLAVIVVLAIIMIIAIPAVLDIMNNARKKTFAMSIDKYVTAVQQQYISDSNFGTIPGAGLYAYNIKDNLGLTSTGDNEGYVIVNAYNVDNVKYFVFLHDNNYMITNYDVTTYKMPDKDNSNIIPYNSGAWNTDAANEYYACRAVDPSVGSSSQCLDPHGYVITG